MLEVYFEEENYPVSESVGQVETCLLLNCEAAEPVTVTLSAQENIPADAQGMVCCLEILLSLKMCRE